MPKKVPANLVTDEEIFATPKEDLISIFTKPVDEMSDEELENTYQKIRELRAVKIASTKKKSQFDYLLDNLTPDTARALLEKLGDTALVTQPEKGTTTDGASSKS